MLFIKEIKRRHIKSDPEHNRHLLRETFINTKVSFLLWKWSSRDDQGIVTKWFCFVLVFGGQCHILWGFGWGSAAQRTHVGSVSLTEAEEPGVSGGRGSEMAENQYHCAQYLPLTETWCVHQRHTLSNLPFRCSLFFFLIINITYCHCKFQLHFFWLKGFLNMINVQEFSLNIIRSFLIMLNGKWIKLILRFYISY